MLSDTLNLLLDNKLKENVEMTIKVQNAGIELCTEQLLLNSAH